MSEGLIEVKIGCTGEQNSDLYKTIDFSFDCQFEKINKTVNELNAALNKNFIPFVTIQVPYQQAETQIFKQNSQKYDVGIVTKDNKTYHWMNLKEKDTVKFFKNIEKEFQIVNKLNNHFNLKFSLYDILNKSKNEKPTSIFNSSKIKGKIHFDAQLMEVLTDILRRVSQQFLNSPICALLELFQSLNFKADLQKIQDLPEELSNLLYYLFDCKNWVSQENIKKMTESQGEAVIYITLSKLFTLKIKAEIITLTTLINLFSQEKQQ